MVIHRAVKRGLALLTLISIPALALAQTPTISSLQSGLGSPTNGAAITAGTAATEIQLYVNGNFDPVNFRETVTWTENSVATSLDVIGASSTQLIANVPQSLYTSAGSASITVSETAVTCESSCPSNSSPTSPTFTINPAMAQVGSLQSGIVGSPYSQAFFSGGTQPFTVQFSSSPAPPGLAATATTGNPLTGTPTQAGTFTVNPTITDSWGNVLVPNETLTIVARLVITTSTIPSGIAQQPYSTQIAATGGALPYGWSATGLPPNLTINPGNGTISGTPQNSGTFPITVTVTDNSAQTAQMNYSLVINAVLTITTASLPQGTLQRPYNTTVLAAGGVTPYAWSATGLPANLAINASTGVISGTPTSSGTFPVTVHVSDNSQQTAQANYSLTITPALTITTASLPQGLSQQAYSTTVAASGGLTPYSWSATGLPTNLTINASTGAISGTPQSSGTFPVAVTVTDNTSQSTTANYSLQINSVLTIVTTSLAAGTVQRPYSSTVTATGGVTPYAWSATGLPANLAINASTGVISGTPTGSGTFPVTVHVSDNSSQTAQANYSLTITPALTITTTSLPAGFIQRAYSTTVAASGGLTPYSWSATGLPANLTINASTGAISGTPQSSGTFPVAVTVTDNTSQSTTANYSLLINSAPTIVTTSLAAGTVQRPYSATVTASGGVTPYSWSATGLPANLTINASTGAISGTPQTSGTFPVAVTVTDSASQSATANYSLQINSGLTIVTTSLAAGTVQRPYSSTVTAAGGVTPYTWSATGLPAGLSINTSSGVISGAPTASGTFSVTVQVSDSSSQNAQAVYSLQISSALTITTTGLPPGMVQQTYSGIVSATGGTQPYAWSATGLPGGLSINASSGFISGTPFSSGTSSVTVHVSDSNGGSAQATYSLLINPAPPPPLQITTQTLPNGVAGQTYGALIAANGGAGGYTFTLTSGSVPPGVQFALSGQLFGTPTVPGTFTFTAQVTDSAQNTASRGFSIQIFPGQLTLTGTVPPTVAVNSTISAKFGATGGVARYTFTLTGTPPTGTSFSGGVLSGTATTPGTFGFTITVADSQTPTATASQSFSITVTPAPLAITASLPSGQVGQAYSGQFSATGGVTPYTWSGSAGGGLSVSSSGSVTGTPPAPGTFSISVTVTDHTGATASGTFPVVIAGPGLTITTASLPNGALTSAYSAPLGASGGTLPYTWSATGLPNGLSISSAGVISGTPTALGTFTLNVTVKDFSGLAANANLSLTINPAPLKITTTGISPPALGTSFSVGFGATGGTPPYTWTATGLPAGLSLSSDGTLSGTPTALGTSSMTVTVTDAAKQTASETITVTIALPAAPAVSLSGFPSTGTAGGQVTTSITFSPPYPVDVTVHLTLTFAPAAGADDPNIQFSTGGRTATVIVKAGSTTSLTSVSVQTGTVAGVITITMQLIADNGADITPSPAPIRTITIGAAAPTISSVTATANSTGFTVTIVGFDPTRSITQATFTFTAASGSTLQTTTVTVPVQALFTAWYQSAASAAFGSQFSFTLPFTVTGNVSGIASVTVTLTNGTGTSTSATAPV